MKSLSGLGKSGIVGTVAWQECRLDSAVPQRAGAEGGGGAGLAA